MSSKGQLKEIQAELIAKLTLKRHGGVTPSTPFLFESRAADEISSNPIWYIGTDPNTCKRVVAEWFRTHPDEQTMSDEGRERICRQLNDMALATLEEMKRKLSKKKYESFMNSVWDDVTTHIEHHLLPMLDASPMDTIMEDMSQMSISQSSSSPAFQTVMNQGTTRNLLQQYRSHIISEEQTRIDQLNAQVARLSGVHLPGDSRYMAIHREASAKFSQAGGQRVFERRRLKLERLESDLRKKELEVSSLLNEIADIRLKCVLYAHQVRVDNARRGEMDEERHQRVKQIEAENKARLAKKQKRIEQQQRELERSSRLALPASSSNDYMPAHMRLKPSSQMAIKESTAESSDSDFDSDLDDV